MASISIVHWLLIAIAAVVVLAVVASGTFPRIMRELRRGFSEMVSMARNAPEQGPSRPSWTTIGVLFVIAIAVLAATALFNGTWAG